MKNELSLLREHLAAILLLVRRLVILATTPHTHTYTVLLLTRQLVILECCGKTQDRKKIEVGQMCSLFRRLAKKGQLLLSLQCWAI